MVRKAVRRRWYLDHHGIRRLGDKERGFHYRYADGRPVADVKGLDRIGKLRIPPAWKNVRIARGAGAPLQAIGYDKKGRAQYRYHDEFRRKQDEAKFLRLVQFAESLPRLRRRVARDLTGETLGKERVLAAITRLIDQGFFRVGNERSAKHEKTYGLTTITPDHVEVAGDEIHFDYIGKWKKQNQRVVRDAAVAAVARELEREPGRELFRYRSGERWIDVKDRHVNEYIQSIIGKDYTAKDFRTWAGTLVCGVALAMQQEAETRKKRKSQIASAVEATASVLGNTAAVCRKSYICPRLLDDYLDGYSFEPLRGRRRGTPVARLGLSREEKALIRFLRETIADRRRSPRAA